MNKYIKIIATLIVLMICQCSSLYSQGVIAQRVPVNEKSIPLIVKESFKLQYKTALLKSWYVTHLLYWQNDYSSNWYADWYGPRTVVIYTYENPNYFEVDFLLTPGEPSRAIYNLYGYWYETRTMIKALPMPIYDALNVSKYKDWKLQPVLERIESPAWPIDIYRFNLTKGMRSHIVRMDVEGNMIQEKHVEK